MKRTFQIKGNRTAYTISNPFEDKIMLITLWSIFKAIHKTKFKMDYRCKHQKAKLKNNNRRIFFVTVEVFLKKTKYLEAIKD